MATTQPISAMARLSEQLRTHDVESTPQLLHKNEAMKPWDARDIAVRNGTSALIEAGVAFAPPGVSQGISALNFIRGCILLAGSRDPNSLFFYGKENEGFAIKAMWLGALGAIPVFGRLANGYAFANDVPEAVTAFVLKIIGERDEAAVS